MPFVIPLSNGREPLFRQVYSGLREAVLSGTLKAGEKLPSTREFAEQLGVSRTVVLLAYDQLIAEGFVVGRSGSGTYVSPVCSRGWSPREHAAARAPLAFWHSSHGRMEQGERS